MGILDLFTFKSPEQREADRARYAQWAFPYGEPQKERIRGLLAELLPEEPQNEALAVYLIGREGLTGGTTPEADGAQRAEEEKLYGVWKALRRQLPGTLRGKMPRYAALILADQSVGPELGYPSAEELRKRAGELEPILASMKK